MPLTITEIEEAKKRIAPYIVETPLIRQSNYAAAIPFYVKRINFSRM